MSDLSIVILGLVTSLKAAGVLYYLGADEIDRQWHEKQLKRLRGGK